MIHLDTNFVIRGFTRGTAEDAALRRWLSVGARVAASAPTWAEFMCGPVTPAHVRAATAVLGDPLPLDGPGAALAAELFNHAGRRRGSLGDCMVAAIALRHGAELATADRADFARFAGLGLRLASG